MEAAQNSTTDEPNTPSPSDLTLFLPWACDQLLVNIELVITKNVVEDLSTKTKANKATNIHSKTDVGVGGAMFLEESGSKQFSFKSAFPIPRLWIEITNDQFEYVTGLLFKNNIIPRQVMQILCLIINFHARLASLTFKRALNVEAVYELNKCLITSKITTIHIDNCFVPEGNYYILLNNSCLTTLTISRCKIDDSVVDQIAERLKFPGHSALVALSLSTNFIRDDGAKSLGDALRCNLKLAYLNLADNMITDEGALYILNSLDEFVLTQEELFLARKRSIDHRVKRQALVMDLLRENRVHESERKALKSKASMTVKKDKKVDVSKSITEAPALVRVPADIFGSPSYDKAQITADRILGPYVDPHAISNTVVKGGEVFCLGNNTLNYLNLAYNNLSYFSVQKMADVLRYQKETARKPRGLINVWLEGNPLPSRCKELAEIDFILDKGLSTIVKKPTEKRTQRRSN